LEIKDWTLAGAALQTTMMAKSAKRARRERMCCRWDTVCADTLLCHPPIYTPTYQLAIVLTCLFRKSPLYWLPFGSRAINRLIESVINSRSIQRIII
jgi:hypothetical protein